MEQIGRDGWLLLKAIYGASKPYNWLAQIPAVNILRQVWLQQYQLEDYKIKFRQPPNLPPAALLLGSPYDRDSRLSQKRDKSWQGYRVHFTESCDEDLPHLIIHIHTTPATTQDVSQLQAIHRELANKEILPAKHYVNAGYMDAEHLIKSEAEYGIELVGPVLANVSWQARSNQGYAQSDFKIDWNSQKVECPGGKFNKNWIVDKDVRGEPTIYVQFRRADCQNCEVKTLCTRSTTAGRELSFRPQPEFEALEKRREYQKSAEFAADYALRSGIEGTLSQGVGISDLRNSRYFGMAKTHLQHIATAAALNLKRLDNWLNERPRAKTRISHFKALALVS